MYSSHSHGGGGERGLQFSLHNESDVYGVRGTCQSVLLACAAPKSNSYLIPTFNGMQTMADL